MMRRIQWLTMFLSAMVAAVVLFAQQNPNPMSILGIGPATAVTTTLPVSGTVTANAGTNLNTSALGLDATLTTIDTDLKANITLHAGTNVIGHVIADTGSTTAVTGNVTVTQATGTNLHAVIDSGSTTAVTGNVTVVQGTGTNLHAVLDTTSTTAVTQATGTNLHAVLDATSTTAVTQATATNLNAAVVGTGTAGSPAGNILTVQGVASMTKLLVTPDSVALPANQSVNVAQVNGVTTTMGAGATGTGVQRINDVASSATGAAPPASAIYVGGLISGATGGFLGGITVCELSKPVNISTAVTTLMITGVASRQVRICAFHLFTNAANNVAWLEGTGATCGTGTAGMAGGTTAATGYVFVANQGVAMGSGLGQVLVTATAGDSVCLITSAATQLSGSIEYTIY